MKDMRLLLLNSMSACAPQDHLATQVPELVLIRSRLADFQATFLTFQITPWTSWYSTQLIALVPDANVGVDIGPNCWTNLTFSLENCSICISKSMRDLEIWFFPRICPLLSKTLISVRALVL